MSLAAVDDFCPPKFIAFRFAEGMKAFENDSKVLIRLTDRKLFFPDMGSVVPHVEIPYHSFSTQVPIAGIFPIFEFLFSEHGN